MTARAFFNQILGIDTRKKFILAGGILLPVAFLAAYLVGLPAYRHAKEHRAASQATQFFGSGDFSNASVAARRALSLNPANASALEIMAKLAEGGRSPAALEWRKRLVEAAPTVENKLSLASAALRFEPSPFPLAKKLLDELKPTASTNARFHVFAAELALREQDKVLSEHHFAEALRLEPTNTLCQLNLTVLRLQSTNASAREVARRNLAALRTDQQVGAKATRWLIRDSLSQTNLPAAAELSQELLSAPHASFEDRLLNLSVLRTMKSTAFAPALESMKARSGTNSTTFYALHTWMMENALEEEAGRWWEELETNVKTNMPAPLARVDYLALKKDWMGTEQFLTASDWGDAEFMRQALLSKASMELGEENIASMRWRAAMRAAANTSGGLLKLLNLTVNWGLAQEREELLWEIAQHSPRERWAFVELDKLYTSTGNTKGLHKLYRTMLGHDRTNVMIRNNVAATALLLGEDIASAHELAKALYSEQPTNPAVASTYAFSLWRQDKARDAATVLAKFDPALLERPPFALYNGMVLHALGQTNQAAKYFAAAAASRLLPEERALLPAN